MAELNLNQITDKLNEEFAGGSGRRLVFWYDAAAEFAEDIDDLPLNGAKVLRLEEDNQFYIKYFLECVDRETSYLVYAPFAKPSKTENHLWDTIIYSKEFFADRASLIALDLGIAEEYKYVLQKHIKFFAAKDRTQKFYDLEADSFTSADAIEDALMSVLCGIKLVSFDDVVRCVFEAGGVEENHCLAEFEKYGLLEAFWQHIADAFGYSDDTPSLEKLAITMFVTYASRTVNCDVSEAWKPFVSQKAGNIMAFLRSLMNNIEYGELFDRLSADIYGRINGEAEFAKMQPDDIAECDAFKGVESIILKWAAARIENEDTGARLGGRTIPELCAERRKSHFGRSMENEYRMLEAAWHIISMDKYADVSGIDNVAKAYTECGFEYDRYYRHFCCYYDRIAEKDDFEKLRTLTENVYTNEYLNKAAVNWAKEFAAAEGRSALDKQTEFFRKRLSMAKEKTVVIISDAMRYEVGVSLADRLNANEKCRAEITPMQSVLPSYTRLGMAALLPHGGLSMSDSYDVLAGGRACDSLKQREAILKSAVSASRTAQFDDVKAMSRDELRALLTGQDIVYVYHNQIDARGDKASSENEVFTACEEAIIEIYDFVKRLSSSANVTHFIVTADHGFIYKRDKLTASDKIGNVACAASALGADKMPLIGKRYVVAEKAIVGDGILSVALGNMLNNDDVRAVSFPIGSDIFKTAGSGLNYVHGGCSPQEMIVPVIEIKTEKGKTETASAKIELWSNLTRITNLITMAEFCQTEPVSDVVKEASYRVGFFSESGEAISDEHIVLADKKNSETIERKFRLKFTLKNRQYGTGERYWLVAYDTRSNLEVLRHEVAIDIPFADDFGF